MKYTALLIVFFFCGCATLGMLADEASQITPAELETSAGGFALIMNTLVPEPYRAPAILGAGYVLALIRRVYKKNKGAT